VINILIAILIISVIAILALDPRSKGLISVAAVLAMAILSSIISIRALAGTEYSTLLSGPVIFGNVLFRVDALSAWFILTINFTFLTGAFYGFHYMKKYMEMSGEITLHCVAFLLAHFALLGICSVQNGFIFLLLWELLALSVFILIIFEHHKPTTIRAGINYLIQSHISIVFIMLGFIYIAFKTGSYSFEAINGFTSQHSSLAGTVLFLCFFIGFAIKAGFVPFHTWLPYAHPSAPSHVSGIMSGVVIKVGIYGILRMLLLIKTDYSTIGFIILFLSLFTGIYGVMVATIQHDLKKLLAYHSIENIGIIGIGIGLGCIGLGAGNKLMAVLGFTGAMLHTLNHSLFKSLLFYSAGNVLQAAGTVHVERLGGLIRKMPQTALLFLLAAIAICGLPPLNGFVSEFLIFGGIYRWLGSASLISLIAIVFSIGGLVFIGGLALLCFTKAFSIVFLGNSRSVPVNEIEEMNRWRLLPMYMAIVFMLAIGLYPAFFVSVLERPVGLFTRGVSFSQDMLKAGAIDSLKTINWLFLGFIVLVSALLGLRKLLGRNKIIESGPTWGCGYATAGSKLQYTANSFVRSYAKLAKPVLEIEKKEGEIDEVFPSAKHFETDSYDKIERILIDKPLKAIDWLTNQFLFLQNGRLQGYILYGIIFIAAVIGIPMIIDKIKTILHFLNNL
jgi:hydrogenase-4 component B